MGRRKTVTKPASYWFGVRWIAANDNAGQDRPADCGTDGEKQQAMRDEIAGYVSTCLLADLFGADQAAVAHDVFVERSKMQSAEKATAAAGGQ